MRDRPHLRLTRRPQEKGYTHPGAGGNAVEFQRPPRNRRAHAKKLTQEVLDAQFEAHRAREQLPVSRTAGQTLTFISEKDFALHLEGLDHPAHGFELLSVVAVGGVMRATVRFQQGKLKNLLNIIKRFEREKDRRSGKPKHDALVRSISQIRLAAVRDLWTDNLKFPPLEKQMWWEVWLYLDDHLSPEAAHQRFAEVAREVELRVAQDRIEFPERAVVLVWGSARQFGRSIDVLTCIAELRFAQEPVSHYVETEAHFQHELVTEAAARVNWPQTDAPAVCLLDSGVDRGHPLLVHALAEDDAQAVDPTWGASDHDRQKHGTGMAGLALYGPLTDVLTTSGRVRLRHRLESVKILPRFGSNDPKLYGQITAQALARAEIQAPGRRRVACLAITDEKHNRGDPTSWSGYVDRLCFGGTFGPPTLMIVSAGNARDEILGEGYAYPNCLFDSCGIEDPGQAWNVLTVGAFTERHRVTDPTFRGHRVIAPPGDLAPTSRTSQAWDPDFHGGWPLKPDIVMEGGNWVEDATGNRQMPADLGLLTTSMQERRLLTFTGDTSAATALAARAATIICSHYPAIWPETVRGLLVHSANWTRAMLDRVPGASRGQVQRRLRCYGYGVPNLDHALFSAGNSAVLLAEEVIQPYRMDTSDKKVKTNVMHVHRLPWPRQLLERLDGDVTVRVTLSYFVDADAERIVQQSHRYQSHGLRFKMPWPQEKPDHFLGRISRDEWEESGGRPARMDHDDRWVVGDRGRTHGSIHSDWWTGPAADLASSGYIAVYPVTGWWRERPHLGFWDRKARYSLIVSLETGSDKIDLYTAIASAGITTPAVEVVTV